MCGLDSSDSGQAPREDSCAHTVMICRSHKNFFISVATGKAKAVPLHTMKGLGGEEVYLLLILDLGTRWGKWSALRPGRALAPGKGPPVPIVQEAVLAPEPVWTQRLEEKSFRLCRGSNIDRPVVQPVVRHYTD
jgi:hypothetical protein